eukprot:3977123-Pyramimonas_sp.AAC.1
MEVGTGDQFEKQWQFQEKLVSRSDGMLAKLHKHDLRYLTLAGSHTIAGVRAVKHGCKTTLDEYADSEGRLSRDKVVAMCKSYELPLESGMEWTIVRYQVDLACPLFADVVQEAGNASNDTHRKTTAVQSLLMIHQMAQSNVDVHGDPCWDAIETDVVRSQKVEAGNATGMCAYVRQWSGGENPILLHDLQEFAGQLRIAGTLMARRGRCWHLCR